MNTILLTIDDQREIANFEEGRYFDKFVFDEFKIILQLEGEKLVYRVKIEDSITHVKFIMTKGVEGYNINFDFEEDEESITIIGTPYGNGIDKLVKGFSSDPILKNASSDEAANAITKLVNVEGIFISKFKQYVMNRSYERTTIHKETDRVYNPNRKSSKKSSKPVKDVETKCLLGDIVEYVSRNHVAHIITCECWDVRGHFRHYKSGKVVWIDGFKKGKNKDLGTSKEKVYTI